MSEEIEKERLKPVVGQKVLVIQTNQGAGCGTEGVVLKVTPTGMFDVQETWGDRTTVHRFDKHKRRETGSGYAGTRYHVLLPETPEYDREVRARIYRLIRIKTRDRLQVLESIVLNSKLSIEEMTDIGDKLQDLIDRHKK